MSLTYRKSINIMIFRLMKSRVTKEGERDGKQNIPETSDAEPNGVILKILTDARAAWDRYLSEKKLFRGSK